MREIAADAAPAVPGTDPDGTTMLDLGDEAWVQSEEERVTRWLRARTGGDARLRDDDPDGPIDITTGPQGTASASPANGSFGRSAVDLDAYHRDLVAAVDVAQREIDLGRREAEETRAVVEAEIRTLEERRQRLTTGLTAQQAEYEHVLAHRTAVRQRLGAEVGDLEARCGALHAQLATARAEADAMQREHVRVVAELEGRCRALVEERTRLTTAIEVEYPLAEKVRQDRIDVVSELEGEVAALRAYRTELATSVEAERIRIETERRAQVDETDRLQAEITLLELEAAHLAEPEPEVAVPPAAGLAEGQPLDPSGQLAAAVAELGRHMAAVLEAERARSRRLAEEHRQARERFDAERRQLAARRAGSVAEAPPPRTWRARRRRRRLER